MENIAQIGHAQKGILFFEFFAFIGMFSYGIFVSSLFFRKKRQLPHHYIVLVGIGTIFVAVDLLLGHIYLDVPYVFDTVNHWYVTCLVPVFGSPILLYLSVLSGHL